MRFASAVLSFALLLSACSSDVALPTLPEGVQTLSGTIAPSVISTAHRGAHLLRQGTEDRTYLESATVNLREFQGRSVTLKGRYQRNIDPHDLPVFVVEDIVQSEQETREWHSDALRVTGQVPSRWGISGTGTAVTFIPAGSLTPVVSLLPLDQEPVPSGIALTVGNAKAIRFFDEISGEQRIAVARGQGYLEIAYTPQGHDDPEELRAEWLAFLRTLVIEGAVSTSSSSRTAGSSSSGGSAQEGQPCGGPAGILCPTGMFCAITDIDLNVGVCKRIK